jgi:hypothetical protein
MAKATRKRPRPNSGWEDRWYSNDTHSVIPLELGRLPSVTTITGCYPKPWMMPWIMKESRKKAVGIVHQIANNPRQNPRRPHRQNASTSRRFKSE